MSVSSDLSWTAKVMNRIHDGIIRIHTYVYEVLYVVPTYVACDSGVSIRYDTCGIIYTSLDRKNSLQYTSIIGAWTIGSG